MLNHLDLKSVTKIGMSGIFKLYASQHSTRTTSQNQMQPDASILLLASTWQAMPSILAFYSSPCTPSKNSCTQYLQDMPSTCPPCKFTYSQDNPATLTMMIVMQPSSTSRSSQQSPFTSCLQPRHQPLPYPKPSSQSSQTPTGKAQNTVRNGQEVPANCLSITVLKAKLMGIYIILVEPEVLAVILKMTHIGGTCNALIGCKLQWAETRTREKCRSRNEMQHRHSFPLTKFSMDQHTENSNLR